MKEPLHSRRIWKRLACLAAMLFCVAAAGVPALAQEAAGDSGSGQSGIPEEWAQVTQEAPMTAGDFSGMTLSDWLEKGAEILRESLHEPLRLLARLCGLLLLAAVGKSMCTERTSPELAGLVDTVVTLAVFTLCSSCMLALTGVLQDAIETSRVYIISFVPVFASVLTACGQVGGAALYSGFFFGAAMVMADILCRVGLPLTRVLLALLLVSVGIFRLSKIRFSEVRFMMTFTLVFLVLNNLFIFLFNPDQGTALYGTRHMLFHLFWRYDLTQEQLFYMLNISLKYFVSLPIAILFISATNPSEFAASLSSIGVSYRVSYSVALALRYIPDIQRDYHAISQAQQARGIELGKKEKLLMRLKNSVNILLPLILSSLQRIDVISSAMELRGFGKDKKKRTWYMKRPMKRNDFIAIALGALLLAFSLGMIAANGGRFWNPFAQ